MFKLVTAAAGLESGAIDTDTTFADQPAESRSGFRLDGFRIRDAARDVQLDHPLDLFEAMEVSSNIWFAHAGLATGAAALSSVAARFGFGSAIDFELPTASSQVNGGDGPLDGFADRVELANAAYGQAEVLATPLQMALVAAAIANDGVMMQPTLVDRLVSGVGRRGAHGATRHRPGAVERTPPTILRDAMVQAVEGRYADRYAGRREGARCHDRGQERHRAAGSRAGARTPGSWASRRPTQPRIAIVVVVENAGAGSERAVPLGGRLMTAWLKRFAADPTP